MHLTAGTHCWACAWSEKLKLDRIDQNQNKSETCVNAILIGSFAVLFLAVHLANSWVFQSIEITSHVSMVYLPAFLRLFNVLILGPVRGSLATLLGGVLLMQYLFDAPVIGLLNIVCSMGGPLVALLLFRVHFQRPVNLSSVRDLVLLAIACSVINPLLHHATWSVFDPVYAGTPLQLMQMVVGDFMGCLIGVGLMKWAIDRWKLAAPRA